MLRGTVLLLLLVVTQVYAEFGGDALAGQAAVGAGGGRGDAHGVGGLFAGVAEDVLEDDHVELAFRQGGDGGVETEGGLYGRQLRAHAFQRGTDGVVDGGGSRGSGGSGAASVGGGAEVHAQVEFDAHLQQAPGVGLRSAVLEQDDGPVQGDRKSTRLNSSH